MSSVDVWMSGTNFSSKVGFDENEAKEFSRAIKQQLLVQTPLQVLLETLFSRLQNQAQAFNDLAHRVERLEVRDMDKDEILKRMQLYEERLSGLGDLATSKLSPFNQMETTGRLDKLEKQMEEKLAELSGPCHTGHAQTPAGSPDMAPLLDFSPPAQAAAPTPTSTSSFHQPPSSMGGAANLVAHQGPVVFQAEISAEIASRLATVEEKLKGVYNLAGKLISLEAMAVQMGTPIPDLEFNPELASQTSPKINFSKSAATPSSTPLPTPSQPASSSGLHAIPSTASLPAVDASSSTADLSLVIRRVAEDNREMQMALGLIRGNLSKVQTDLSESTFKTSRNLEALQASQQEAVTQLSSEIAAVRALVKREPEVSFADFSIVRSQVEAATREAQGAQEAVAALKEKEIKTLSASIAEVKKWPASASGGDGGRASPGPSGASGGVRDMDTLFHTRISTLEAKMSDIQGEVQHAVSGVLGDLARASDLEELGALLEFKASQEDIQQLAQQQAALATSVNGMASWLTGGAGGGPPPPPPPAGAAGGGGGEGGAVLSVTSRRKGGGGGTPSSAGGFLPQVISGRGASPPTTLGGTPVAPKKTINLSLQAVEEYSAAFEDQPKGSPSTRVGGRVAVQIPSGGLKGTPQGGPRVPIFIA